MIKFEFERENEIVFDVNVGSTDFVGEPEVRFCIDLGTMVLATKAIRGKNTSYTAIVPENIPNLRDKSYPCHVEIIIGTKRFVPFNDDVMFTEGNAPEVRLNSNKPVKPTEDKTEEPEQAPEKAVEESVKPSKPQRKAKPVVEEKVEQKPIGELVKIAAADDLKEHERKKKEKQLVDMFKTSPVKIAEKGPVVELPKTQHTFEMKGISGIKKTTRIKEDRSNYVVDTPLVKVVRAEIVEQ